jgi:hypothetical protein
VSKIFLQELQLHREVFLCEILGQEFVRHESQLLSIHIMEVAVLGSSVQIEYSARSKASMYSITMEALACL